MAKSPYRRSSHRSKVRTDRSRSSAENPVFESLEARRLLTVLTVPDADDPMSGAALDLDYVPEAVFFTYYTQPFMPDPADPTNIPTVEERAVGIRFILSGTPGAQVEIKDLHGRDLYFRPQPASLAPPRTTFEGILVNADGAVNEEDEFVFTPNGSAAYETGQTSIESVVVDVNGDELLDIVTVNNQGAFCVTIQYGQGEPYDVEEDEPAEPDGTFGEYTNTDEDGNEFPAQWQISYPGGTSGASALAVEDMDGDDFPEIIVAFRNTDNVAVFTNLGTSPVGEDADQDNFDGFDTGTLIDVGDQPVDVAVDASHNIWVLCYGDETIQQVVSQGSQRVFTIFGSTSDRVLIDSDNDDDGDALGAVGDTRLSVGRLSGDTLRGHLTFELPQILLDAVYLSGQHVVKTLLTVVEPNQPAADMGYQVNLFLADDNQPDGDAVVSDFENDDYSRADTDANPFISETTPLNRAYQISLGLMNDARVIDAATSGDHHVDFRLQGNHILFGTPESELSETELEELNALSPYRITSADGMPAPVLSFTLSDTFSTAGIYPVGEAPTSLTLADLNADADVDFIVTNEGSDDLWVFLGDGTAAGFGEPDGDGDGFRDPSNIFSTQRPDQYYSASADIDAVVGTADGIYDPIVDDSNPHHASAVDIDLDGNVDIAIALTGNVYPGTTVTTSGGVALANTIIPGGVAVFWGDGSGSLFEDFNGNLAGVQPDFLEDSFLANQPTPILTDGNPLYAMLIEPFFRGPSRIVAASVNPAADQRMGEDIDFLDLVVASVDPLNGAAEDELKAVATRGGVYTMDGRWDAQYEAERLDIGVWDPITGEYLNAPLLGYTETEFLKHGRIFGLPLEHGTSDGFLDVAPDLPTIRYIDVAVADVGGEALSSPTGDEEVPVPELIVTRADNATPYEIDNDAATRNVQVLLQLEGEPDLIPIFNDGIGTIRFIGADENTRLTVQSGIINTNFGGGDELIYVNSPILAGFQMEAPLQSTGYPLDMLAADPETGELVEYPEGVGSLMLGSLTPRPFTMDADAYNGSYRTGYRNPDQGFKADDNQSIGRIVWDGRVFGRSEISGGITTFSAGYLGGDLIIDGDAGLIHIATDSGWIGSGDGSPPTDIDEGDDADGDYWIDSTLNTIQVGRMLRELTVGGALYSQVTVLGETGDPVNRPPIDQLRCIEYEVWQEGDTQVHVGPGPLVSYPNMQHSYFRTPAVAFEGYTYHDPIEANCCRRGMALYTAGSVPLRNDTISEAQFVGGTVTSVSIAGWLNDGVDLVDYYSFAADGGSQIGIKLTDEFFAFDEQLLNRKPSVYIVDRDERILASLERGESQFTFTAPHTGVFFLRIASSNTVSTIPYTVKLQGIAPVTLGQVRSGAMTILMGSGAIQTIGGNIGHIAAGQAAVEPEGLYDGMDGSDTEDVAALFGFSTLPGEGAIVDGITSANNIYGITVGGDMIGTTINAPGAVGTVYVGYSSWAREDDAENVGDFWASYIFADSLAYMDLWGSFAGESLGPDAGDRVTSRTGGIEVRDSIGTVHIGEQLFGDSAFFTIGERGMFDLLTVDVFSRQEDEADEEVDFTEPGIGIRGDNPVFTTGTGSDIRFLDIPNSMVDGLPGTFVVDLVPGSPLSFTDDSGAEVTIRITGGSLDSIGAVTFFEVDGSEGVAIARIDVVLADGANLVIRSDRKNAVTSIGRIRVQSSSEESNIIITGPGEVDVYRIEVFTDPEADAGDGVVLNRIKNTTPGGDLVAVDAFSLNNLEVTKGDLGRTQVSGVGPTRLGPSLGIVAADPGDGIVGAPMSVNLGSLTAGQLIAKASPIDYWLDGLVVRNGDVNRVRLAGAAGDVIVENGDLNRLTANADNKLEPDGYDGIIGSVYAENINRVEIGSGLMHEGESHLARAGIFADHFINRITGKGVGNDIEGLVSAAGTQFSGAATANDVIARLAAVSINRVYLTGGASLVGAEISGGGLNDWFINPNDIWGGMFTGDINRVRISGGGTIFGSMFVARNINQIDNTQGVWDTSIAHARNDITRIRAAEFRNSLVNGRLDESPHNPLDTISRFDPYLPEGAGADYNTVINSNYILATGNVDSILTSKNGNITDLVIEIAGDLTSLKAHDIVRTEVGVSTTLHLVDAKGRILASEFTAGDINRIRAGEAIRTTSIEAAGPIDRVEVRQGEIYNTFVRSDGTDGQIGRIVARTRIENATIESAGPIYLVQAKTGDVNVDLTTFKAGEAHLYNVTAGRDIRGSYNVDGDIVLMRAGENLGTDPALLPADADTEIIIATHNLHEIDASGGQIYTEIRVQGAQTGTVKIGDVVTRNGTAMSASTATYVFAGSVNHFDSRGAFNATIESRSGGIGTLAFRGNVGAAASLVAMDGGINRVAMTGTFAGTVYADEDIQSFSVNGTVNGGSVTSDQDIRQATFTGAVNSFILMAGNTITSLNARSSLTNTTIGAGERIAKAYVGGLATDVNFVAGLESLGADGALGGGDDTVTSGDIDTLTLAGGSTRVNALAGWDVGLDGAVDPDPDALVDDSVAPGLSVIDTVTASGAVLNSFIRADTSAPAVPGFNGQTTFAVPEPAPTGDAISAVAVRTYVFAVNDPDSGAPGVLTLTITYAGPGFVEPTIIDNTGDGFSADDRLSRLDIYGSDGHSNLTVNGVLRVTGVEDRTGFAHLASDAGGLTITAAEDRSFGDVLFDGDLVNTDSVAFDGNVDSFTVNTINTTGVLAFAELLDDFTAATFTSGTLTARELSSAEITSGFAGTMNAETAGSVLIAGVWTGVVSVTDDIASVTAAAFRGTVRAGGDIQRFNATSAYRGIVSAGDNLGPARVIGNTDDSFFLAGFDVGPDGAFGGGDDALSNGDVHSVNVGGNFTRSDVIAGIQRGADGFHGTSDDVYAPGLSNIGRVTIGGADTGSNIGSESYAVLATGTVAPVTVAGHETLGSGNFVVKDVDTDVTPVQVTELRTVLDGDSYTTYITFNQDIDTSTLSSSITISSTAATPNTLVEGTDYFLTYDDATRTVVIAFEPHVGQSTDPPDQGPGVDERPPGVYLITIEADPAAGGLTSRTAGGTLDGDGDGFANGDATEPDYERGVIVGDAGDRLSQITITLDDNNTPIDPTDDQFATLYGATDVTSTDIVPINEVTLLSGIIGNHPDETPLFFSERLDVDAYAITVEAGDVVRVRTVFAEGDFYVTLRDASDYNVDSVRAGDGEAGGRSLATGSLEDGYVFQRPGTYYLTVVARAVADPNYVFVSPYPNWPPSMISHGILPYGGILSDPGIADVGDYTLEILHFRDGDTGFLDAASNPIGTLLDTAAGPVTVSSAIGFAGFAGRPSEIINDADVFLLNNGIALPPGSIVDVSLLLSELGADIESIATGQNTSPLRDTPGVELAIFDVTNASHFTDAQLIAAPTINAAGDRLTGDTDFSYSVTLPGDPDTTPGTPGASRIYAIMVQGNQQSDYSLSVEVTSGNGLTPTRGSQNVLIELSGGTLDWLEVFGTTDLDGFDLNVVGFAGQESTVIATVMTRLNAIFASVDVTFATSSAAFENQDFTTVFLSSSFAPPAFGDNIEYAFNNGIDVRNSNTNQEVAVFMPKFAPLGLGLGEEEELSNAIANVVAKELAKTFGLREIDAVAADASNPSMTNIPYPFAQDDSIMTENFAGAWTGTLAFYVDPMSPMTALQLDPGEFLMGSATPVGMLDAALDD